MLIVSVNPEHYICQQRFYWPVKRKSILLLRKLPRKTKLV